MSKLERILTLTKREFILLIIGIIFGAASVMYPAITNVSKQFDAGRISVFNECMDSMMTIERLEVDDGEVWGIPYVCFPLPSEYWILPEEMGGEPTPKSEVTPLGPTVEDESEDDFST